MDINIFFKAYVENNPDHTVICDIEHNIVYMNKAAVQRYEKRGGAALIGKSIFDCHNEKSVESITKTINDFKENPDLNRVFTFYNSKYDYDVYIVALRDENGELIGYYEKHENRTHEGDKT